MVEALDECATAEPTERRRLSGKHFTHRFLSQPPEQIGGVKETIANFLRYFLTPDIAQVFCPTESTFDFSDIDRGKIICIAMPQNIRPPPSGSGARSARDTEPSVMNPFAVRAGPGIPFQARFSPDYRTLSRVRWQWAHVFMEGRTTMLCMRRRRADAALDRG